MISNKKVVNYKVSNFSGYTTILHLRSFEKFKFSNMKNSDVLYLDKSNSNKKWFNYKVL
jgi:hypothetical protein